MIRVIPEQNDMFAWYDLRLKFSWNSVGRLYCIWFEFTGVFFFVGWEGRFLKILERITESWPQLDVEIKWDILLWPSSTFNL